MKKTKLKTLAAIFLSTTMLVNTLSINALAYMDDELTYNNEQIFSSEDIDGSSQDFTVGPMISSDIDTKSDELIKVIVEFKTAPIAVANSKGELKASAGDIEAVVKAEHESFKNAFNKSIKNSENIKSTKNITGSKSTLDSSASDIALHEEYFYAFNGIALTIPSNQVEDLVKLPQVNRVWKDIEFTLPEETVENISLNTKSGDVDMESFPSIGVDRLHEEGILGEGIKVGVLDTGIDYNHPDLKDAYKGGYDFANDDNDPMETSYIDWQNSGGFPEIYNGKSYYTSHGTHVSGTIAANAKNTSNIKAMGVAPNVELYAYKVLGAYGSGETAWILSGIDRAVQDKMDVINLSLGATVNDPLFPTSIAINNAVKAGVVPIIAAGNSGPDDYTLNSPGAAPLAITVGASDTSTTIPTFTGFAELNSTINFKLFANNYEFDLNSLKDQSIEMVHCGLGRPEDYKDKDMKDKIALVQRGTLSLVEKVTNAKAAGAKAVFLYNNVDGYINTYLDISNDFMPTFNITKADGEALVNNITENKMFTFDSISSEIKEGDNLADFSSRGPVGSSQDIKPDVVAPGVNIFSTYPGFIYDRDNGTDYSYAYNKISGTSMATPHVAGVVALMLSDAKANGKTLEISDIKSILMNTSEKLNGDYSVYEVGAGRINAYDAIKDSVELKVTNISQSVDSNNNIVDIDNVTGALNFGSLYKENRELTSEKVITVVNNSNEDKNFNISVAHSTAKGLIQDSDKNNVQLKVSEQITVPAGKIIHVPTTLVISEIAATGFYEGTIVFSNADNNEEDYRVPYAVRYADKGIQKFNLGQNAIMNDTRFIAYTDIFIRFNSPMESAKLYLKDAETGERIGFVREYSHLSYAAVNTEFFIKSVFRGTYQPIIGDYVENKLLLAPEGHYKLEFEAIDKDGAKYSAEDHIFIDNTPPTVTFDKEPGAYSISEADYTVEDGIKAFYVHGTIHDETIDKLKALGYETDAIGKYINQALNTMYYSAGTPNPRNFLPEGALIVDENGNFKFGITPEDIENDALELMLIPEKFSYAQSVTTLDNLTKYEFSKAGEAYGTLTYEDDVEELELNDIFTTHVNVLNMTDVNELNFSVGLKQGALYDVQSIEISDEFKNLLDAKGLTAEISYKVNQIGLEKICDISIEINDGNAIDIIDLTSIVDITTKCVAESPSYLRSYFVVKSNPSNNYTTSDGKSSMFYLMCPYQVPYISKTSHVQQNGIQGEAFFNESGSGLRLPYDKLGIKVYVIDPEGNRYDGEVGSNGKFEIKVPSNLQDGVLYEEIPGHFKNYAPAILGKGVNGKLVSVVSNPYIFTAYAGDINGDNIINETDLDLVTADLGKTSNDPYFVTDLNKDGTVDAKDVAFVNSNMSMVNPRLIEDAEGALATLKVSQDAKDIPKAQEVVNELPECDKKQELLTTLNQLVDAINLNHAEKAVEKAEGSLLQEDVDAAMDLVKALSDSDTKTSLLERLSTVQSLIDEAKAVEAATKAVEKAEGSLVQADVDVAMDLVKALPESDTKTSLLERLSKAQTIIDEAKNLDNVVKAVEKAEGSLEQGDVDAAMDLVKALSNSDAKTSLLERLSKVQSTIDAAKALENAVKAVEKAEDSLVQADVDAAMDLVKALSDSDTKTSLLERLTKAQTIVTAIEEAIKAIEKAEQSKDKADIDAAKKLVNALPDGSKKTELLKRLNRLPQTGGPIGFCGMLALGGILSAAGVTLYRRKK